MTTGWAFANACARRLAKIRDVDRVQRDRLVSARASVVMQVRDELYVESMLGAAVTLHSIRGLATLIF